jgi:hypothetical protein
MTAAWIQSETTAVRFGATVGKRNARRSVDRALVKRIVREASRRAAPRLEALCAERSLRLDVAFRLKAARDLRRDDQPSVAQWRLALRAEADWLLERLARQVGERPS